MMIDAKKQALKDMMEGLKGMKRDKMKVMVAGDNPESVKKGLETAEDVVEQAAPQMEKKPMESSPKVDSLLASLSPEEKMALHKKLMMEMGSMEGEESEDEESC